MSSKLSPNQWLKLVVGFSASAVGLAGQSLETPGSAPKAVEIPQVAVVNRDKELPEGQEEANQAWKDLVRQQNNGAARGQSMSWNGKAEAAKQFYERFPDHPKAIRAREREIYALFEGDFGSDPNVKSRLAARVTEFRNDQKVEPKKRAEVARSYELRKATQSLSHNSDHRAAFEQVARGLKTEFQDANVGDDMLLSIAAQRGNKRGHAIAEELERTARSPENREKARNLKTRLGLVGKNVSTELPTLAQLSRKQPNKLTVIYSFSSDDRRSLANAKILGERNLERANWVGINIDEGPDADLARKYASEGNFPGEIIYASEGRGQNIARRLGIDSAGIVMLVSEQGDFFDVHVGDDLLRILGSFGL